MRFEFATAARIVFGAGAVREVAPAARAMGSRALLVTGRSPARTASMRDGLEAAGVPCTAFRAEGEPTVDFVRCGTQLARDEQCDLVIAAGGGSAIDAGKAIAALLANGGDPLDYLEVVGQGRPLTCPSAPFIAVPTTAGSGSEVTRNSVLASPKHRVKASLRSPHMLPRMAVVDPELTLVLPPEITASTGLDALTQLIEPYVSIRANAMTDMFCIEGIRRVARALIRACEDGLNLDARSDMAMASLLGGLCLANAGLGAVHGFAAPIGGMFDAPHGAVCAALLPHVMETNVRALRARAAGSEALRRYDTVARLLTGRADACAEGGIEWARRTCEQLRIPALGAYGIRPDHVPAIVENAARASSMKANPIVLTPEELSQALTPAL
jgi:alcohol dehydrogenase class IV